MKTALSPMKILMVQMINHRKTLVRPCITRNRVMAKAVLLHTAAKIENVPIKLPMRPMIGKFLAGIN